MLDTSQIASLLDQKIRAAAIPFYGVSISDASNKATWRVDFMPEASQAQRDQAAAILSGLNTNTATMQYIQLHYDNRIGFLKALKALEDGVRGHVIGVNALADLRAALTAAGAIIGGLNPVIAADFDRARDMLGLTGTISTMTLANCQALFKEARNWLNSRILIALAAADALE